MPVISKQDISYMGFQQDKIVIKYFSRGKVFCIELPKEMQTVLNMQQVCSGEQNRVEKMFYDELQRYKNILGDKCSKKVIFYKIYINAAIWEENPEEGYLLHSSDVSFFDGDCLLGIKYEIVEKIELPNKTYYRELKEEGEEYSTFSVYCPDRDATEIDWSKEREEFFAESERVLEQLILRIFHFFEDKSRLLEYIDGEKQLFAFNEKTK